MVNRLQKSRERVEVICRHVYQLRIILHILPAVMDWCLKLRTNYGRGNQNGLLTLGNNETALSPHPLRNLTTKELFALAVNFDDELDELLAKNTYWRTTRVCAWILLSSQNAITKTAQRVLSLQVKLKREISSGCCAPRGRGLEA